MPEPETPPTNQGTSLPPDIPEVSDEQAQAEVIGLVDTDTAEEED